MSTQHSEQELIRREKLQQLLDMGIDPYPAPTYEVSHTAQYIKANYKEENKEEENKKEGDPKVVEDK